MKLIIFVILIGLVGLIQSSPSYAQVSSPCQFQKADPPLHVAFCDTFDKSSGTGNRAGDLNGLVWGVSRATSNDNVTQGQAYSWAQVREDQCGILTAVQPPFDAHICNGEFVEGANDDSHQIDLAAYPKQPFDIAGRTGTATFDVGATTEGPHGAWPVFVYTDQPVPAPYSMASGLSDTARNSFGFTLGQVCVGNGSGGGSCWYQNQPTANFTGPCTTLDTVFTTTNYQLADLNFNAIGCVLEPSPTQVHAGQLNHFEIRLSQTSAQVWASDPGSTVLREIATADNISMPLTRGLIWIEDVHYNADKFNSQSTHTFYWDNVGFDGPSLPRDLAFDASDNLALAPGQTGNTYCVDNTPGTSCDFFTGITAGTPDAISSGLHFYNLGYVTPATIQIPNVTGLAQAAAAILTFTYEAHNDTPLTFTYSINGHPNHVVPEPNYTTIAWASQTLAVPVPLSEIVTGTNTVNINTDDTFGLDVANMDLILVGAGGLPCNPNPSQPCTSVPGDANGDGTVTTADIVYELKNWFNSFTTIDFATTYLHL